MVNRFCLPGAEPGPEAFRPAQSRSGDSAERAEKRRAFLTAAIEAEIIPQLAFGLRRAPRTGTGRTVGKRARRQPGFDRSVIEHFAGLTLAPDIATSRAYLEGLLQAGHDIESAYLRLLAPAARHLGVMWETDACTFVDVTIGLARLHRLMRDYLPGFHRDAMETPNGLTALLAPAPGEQHTFGLAMAAEFFRRAGWDVDSQLSASDHDIARMVATRSISMIGFSTSCSDRLDALAETITAARRNSRNPAIAVIVGGYVFLQDPRLVEQIGADAMVTDGHQAPLQTQLLVSRLQQQHCR